jgi:hypothetical protein
VGLLLTTTAAVLSSIKDMRRLSATSTDRKTRRANLFSRLLIAIAVIAGGVGLVGIVHDGEEKVADQTQISDLKAQNQNLLVAALIGQTSKPLIYLYFKKSGQAQSWDRFAEERGLAEDTGNKYLIARSIGFAPSSVRQVIFPGEDKERCSICEYIGSISVKMPGVINQVLFSYSGFFDQSPTLGGEFVSGKEFLNILGLEPKDSAFAFNFHMLHEAKAATLYLWLNERYKKTKPLFVVHRDSVSCPLPAPTFDVVQAVYYVQQRPDYKLVVPLVVRNFDCNPSKNSYDYELHPLHEPVILPDSGDN